MSREEQERMRRIVGDPMECTKGEALPWELTLPFGPPPNASPELHARWKAMQDARASFDRVHLRALTHGSTIRFG